MRVLTLSLVISCAACTASTTPTGEGDAAPFLYQSEEHLTVQLRVVDQASAPIAGAIVQLRSLDDDVTPGVLFKGITDADGIVRGEIALRSDQTKVVVTTNLKGFVGPYDDESLRAIHRTFAPSSWLTLDRRSLAQHEISLKRSTP